MDPSSYETLRNHTLLFFVEKLLEKSPRSLHDLSCQFGSRNFTKEMRQIAGGSQAGLKKFLLQYPSIFTLDGEMVSYTTGVKQKIHRDYNKEAVEYFRNRLLQYGFNVRVPIKSLLGHRSQANTEIRHVSGQHITEFRDFLERNPEFVVSEEFVSLKEFEHEKITEFKEVNMNYDKESVYKLCKFFVTLIGEKGPMLVEQLFHQVGVQFDAGEFEGIFKNPNDLAVFLKIQPQCFQVHANLVTLPETYSMGLDFLHRQCENGPKFQLQPPSVSTFTRSPSFTTPPVSVSSRNGGGAGGGHGGGGPAQGPVPLLSLSLSHVNPSPAKQRALGPPPSGADSAPVNTSNGNRTLKQRVNSIIIQTLTENTEKDYKTSPQQQAHSASTGQKLRSTGEERSLLANITIITYRRKCKEVVDYLLQQDFLGVDCEGVNLGIDGRVTLVQVAVPDGAVFIFDMISDGLSEDIQRLMESTVLKVMHDCRNDSVNLYNQFGIELNNIYDTQAAHIVIQSELGQKAKNISLNNLCEIYGVETNQYKDKVKSVYRYDQRYWLRRPLTEQMRSYAASDVITLVRLYPLLNGKLKNVPLLRELTFEQIHAHINPEEVKAKRRLRKNEGDIGELQAKLDGCPDLSRLVLSNRELRLIKHMDLPDSTLDQLSNSVKIARKLQNKSQLSDSSSESNLTSLETNGGDSGCFNTPPEGGSSTTADKIDSIERLIDRICSPGGVKVESCTQTMSTGDIVLSKIWTEA